MDHAGGNKASLLFPSLPDGARILKWNAGSFSIYTYDSLFGWSPSEPTVDPGEGAFLYAPSAFDNTFTGAAHTPVLPVGMVPGQYYFLSDQVAEVGSWESIVGNPPIEGAKVFLYDTASQQTPAVSNYVAYTYHDGTWHPSTPSIPIGVSAFFFVPISAPGWVTREFYFDVNTNNAGGGLADLLAEPIIPTILSSPTSRQAFRSTMIL